MLLDTSGPTPSMLRGTAQAHTTLSARTDVGWRSPVPLALHSTKHTELGRRDGGLIRGRQERSAVAEAAENERHRSRTDGEEHVSCTVHPHVSLAPHRQRTARHLNQASVRLHESSLAAPALRHHPGATGSRGAVFPPLMRRPYLLESVLRRAALDF